MERRRFARSHLNEDFPLRVFLAFDGREERIPLRIADLGEGGCCFEPVSHPLVFPGSMIGICLESRAYPSIRLKARISRCVPEHCAARFENNKPRELSILRDILHAARTLCGD